jgi:hypothetical protein
VALSQIRLRRIARREARKHFHMGASGRPPTLGGIHLRQSREGRQLATVRRQMAI